MRNQKCTIYRTRIITDAPQKEADDTYKCFNIVCPAKIDINGNKLEYVHLRIN